MDLIPDACDVFTDLFRLQVLVHNWEGLFAAIIKSVMPRKKNVCKAGVLSGDRH